MPSMIPVSASKKIQNQLTRMVDNKRPGRYETSRNFAAEKKFIEGSKHHSSNSSDSITYYVNTVAAFPSHYNHFC